MDGGRYGEMHSNSPGGNRPMERSNIDQSPHGMSEGHPGMVCVH